MSVQPLFPYLPDITYKAKKKHFLHYPVDTEKCLNCSVCNLCPEVELDGDPPENCVQKTIAFLKNCIVYLESSKYHFINNNGDFILFLLQLGHLIQKIIIDLYKPDQLPQNSQPTPKSKTKHKPLNMLLDKNGFKNVKAFLLTLQEFGIISNFTTEILGNPFINNHIHIEVHDCYIHYCIRLMCRKLISTNDFSVFNEIFSNEHKAFIYNSSEASRVEKKYQNVVVLFDSIAAEILRGNHHPASDINSAKIIAEMIKTPH